MDSLNEIFNIGNNNLNLEINSIYDIVNSVLGGNLEKNWYEQNNNGKKRGGQRRYTGQAA